VRRDLVAGSRRDLSPEIVARAIATARSRRENLDDPRAIPPGSSRFAFCLADDEIEYDEPEIRTDGNTAGAASGYVHTPARLHHSPRRSPPFRDLHHRLVDHRRDHGARVRPRTGRAPRRACNSRHRGSRRSAGAARARTRATQI
jgi:hypothetical protein